MIDYRDTIEMMNSSDYKERFRAEYFQTLIRYSKLKNLCEKWDAGELKFTPTCPRNTYNAQMSAMEKYIEVLIIRAGMEKVDLTEPTKVATKA